MGTTNYSKTKLFYTWCNMRQRCYNPNRPDYKYYGGKGITVCKKWRDSFLEFKKWAEESGYKDGLTIDRRNNNKNYTPSNCRWATRKTQTRNREVTHRLTLNGKTKSVAEWAELNGLTPKLANDRLRTGVAPEKVFKNTDLRKESDKSAFYKRVMYVKDKTIYNSMREAAKVHHCTPSNISTLCKKGTIWRKVDE